MKAKLHDRKATDKLPFDEWTIEHKHTLRALYSDFLTDTKATPEQVATGAAASYTDFLRKLYTNTHHATP